ncbi:MAG: FG-GAP-like repeat-containing protein [Nannocystaceae bacterium]
MARRHRRMEGVGLVLALALKLACGDAAPCERVGSLCGGPTIKVAFSPTAIVSADLDGDGADDAVLTDGAGRTVSVVWGRRAGGEAARDALPLRGDGIGAAVADVDDDGALDVVALIEQRDVELLVEAGATNSASSARGPRDRGYLQIVGNRGDRTLAPGAVIPTADRPRALAAADLDDDGRPDVVVLSEEGALWIHAGATDLGEPRVVSTIVGGQALVVEDVDGDGAREAVVASMTEDRVAVHYSVGADASEMSVQFAGIGPETVAVADLDGDGLRDIAAYGRLTGSLSVLYQGPARAFSGVSEFSAIRETSSLSRRSSLAIVDDEAIGGAWLTSADVSEGLALWPGPRARDEAQRQVIAAGSSPSETVAAAERAVIGAGPGHVTRLAASQLGRSIASVFAAQRFVELRDVAMFRPSEEHPPALVVIDVAFGGVDGFYRGSDGGFEDPPQLRIGVRGGARCLATADLDLDGDDDLIIGSRARADGVTTGYVTVIEAGAPEPLSLRREAAVAGVPARIIPSDLDGDGVVELIASSVGGGVFVVRARAEVESGALAFPEWRFHDLAVGDLDDDGALDLVATATTVADDAPRVIALRGDGEGGFALARVIEDLEGEVDALEIGDITGDGRLDVMLCEAGVMSTRPGILDAVPPPPIVHDEFARGELAGITVPPCAAFHLVDLDDDGDPDVAGPSMWLREDGPAGHFQLAGIDAHGSAAWWIDATGDGRRDRVSHEDAWLRVGEVTPGPIFAEERLYDAPVEPTSVRAGDLNGDGALELVVGTSSVLPPGAPLRPQSVLVAIGDPSGGIDRIHEYELAARYNGVAVADLDGDGRDELVLAQVEPTDALLIYKLAGARLERDREISLPAAARWPLVRDLDGDGRLDVAGFDAGDDVLVTAFQQPDGAFAASEHRLEVGTWWFPVGFLYGAGDVDGDGAHELLLVNFDGVAHTLLLVRASGSGVFGPPEALITAPSIDFAALVDFDRDGALDLLVRQDFVAFAGVALYPGDGAGGFLRPTVLYKGERVDGSPNVVDLDGDGRSDVIVYGVETRVYFGDGPRSLAEVDAAALGLPAEILSMARDDRDGDGLADLALLRGDGGLELRLSGRTDR